MANDVKVGDQVAVRFGGSVRVGRVVEDRGEIAPGGERLVRIRLELPPDDEFEVELPVSYLEAVIEQALDHPTRSLRDRDRFITGLSNLSLPRLLELEEALESRGALTVGTRTSMTDP